MDELRSALEAIKDSRLNMASSDTVGVLVKSANDVRIGYYFQIGLSLAIFILTIVAVTLLWGNNEAIAAFLGIVGIGGVGWFGRQIRMSVHQTALLQLLIAGSKNMTPEHLDALIDLVGETLKTSDAAE
ncbi:MAG: hypothetical protein AAF662_07015 [Pseudomonadota bacterium]